MVSYLVEAVIVTVVAGFGTFLLIRRHYNRHHLLKDSDYIHNWVDAMHRSDTQAMWENSSQQLRDLVGKDKFWERYKRQGYIDPAQAPILEFVASVPLLDGTRTYYYNVQRPGTQTRGTIAILGDATGKFLSSAL